jgi:hypothetical protein
VTVRLVFVFFAKLFENDGGIQSNPCKRADKDTDGQESSRNGAQVGRLDEKAQTNENGAKRNPKTARNDDGMDCFLHGSKAISAPALRTVLVVAASNL